MTTQSEQPASFATQIKVLPQLAHTSTQVSHGASYGKLSYAKPGTKSRGRVDISPSYLGGSAFGYRPDPGFANLEFSKFFQSFQASAKADLK